MGNGLGENIMPIYIKFDKKLKILRVKATGSLNINEYRTAMQQITSDIDYPANVPTIWDVRAFDFVDFDSQMAKNTSTIRKFFKKRTGAKIAFIVSDPLGYGMARMFQVLTATDDDSLVSYNYEEAELWLKTAQQNGST